MRFEPRHGAAFREHGAKENRSVEVLGRFQGRHGGGRHSDDRRRCQRVKCVHCEYGEALPITTSSYRRRRASDARAVGLCLPACRSQRQCLMVPRPVHSDLCHALKGLLTRGDVIRHVHLEAWLLLFARSQTKQCHTRGARLAGAPWSHLRLDRAHRFLTLCHLPGGAETEVEART